jgi:hypothetical protein
MSSKHHVVGEKNVVAEPAIMRDMRLREKHAAIAEARCHAPAGRAGIDRYAFAYDAIGTDLERGRFTREFAVLWRMANRGEGKDARARAYMRAANDNDMRDELHPVVENGVTSDVAEGTDGNARAEFGSALHDCERVDENG